MYRNSFLFICFQKCSEDLGSDADPDPLLDPDPLVKL
jgi:hypothetical protein